MKVRTTELRGYRREIRKKKVRTTRLGGYRIEIRKDEG